MPSVLWDALPERLAVPTYAGYTLDRPSPAELDGALNDHEARCEFRLPATYREFLHRFGPGELSGYFRISSPVPARLMGQVSEVFDLEAQRAMIESTEDYQLGTLPTSTRRLVLFAETIGSDWLFWDTRDVRDPDRAEYGVYGFARGDRERGVSVAERFADFITDVCLGSGFPVYPQQPWEPEWEFRPGWPLR